MPDKLLAKMLLGTALTLSALQAKALTELNDAALSKVQGEGLAFAMDNFSFRFAPTSFIELTGTAPKGTGWRRGDARYYGLSLTDGEGTTGTDWFGNGCSDSSGFAGALACPLGNQNPATGGVTANNFGIGSMASVYDPYVLRAYQYPGYDYAGNYLSSTNNNMPTVMELIGPSNTDNWRWAFWGELEVDRTNNNADVGACNASGSSSSDCTNSNGTAEFLQSQTIIHGKPVTTSGDPAIFRIMRTTNNPDGDTFGITYQSAISGDFRFSVRQQSDSADALRWVPDFNDAEGMYFKNVDAFLPLGTLHYQTITLDAAGDGNFIIELTRIPNIAAIYNNFYCGSIGGDCVTRTGGSGTDADPYTYSATTWDANADGQIDTPNKNTHGYVRWGDFSAPYPTATATDNGIYFVGGVDTNNNPTNDVVNIGTARIEGMTIQHLKITTLGAGP